MIKNHLNSIEGGVSVKSNIGTVDKIIRYVIGIILLCLLFFLKGNARYWGLLGLIPILTAAFGYCPLYKIFGISTVKKDNKSEK
nr:DUF2892 domain-containing protein [Thermoanaerobacterium butyriciformans]